MSTPERATNGRRKWIVGGLITALGSVFSIVVGPVVVDFAKDAIARSSIEPTCDDPGSLHVVKASSASASNFFSEPNNGERHLPALAIDGDTTTAWVEDGDQKYGEGSTITLVLPNEVDLQMVCVVNGYTKSIKTFQENAKVRVWSVETSGEPTESTLPPKSEADFDSFQKLRITPGKTSSVKLTILSVRAPTGSVRYSDTALSEVEFWAK